MAFDLLREEDGVIRHAGHREAFEKQRETFLSGAA